MVVCMVGFICLVRCFGLDFLMGYLKVVEYQNKCRGDKSPSHLGKFAVALSVNKLEYMVLIMICVMTEMRSSNHEPRLYYTINMDCRHSTTLCTLKSSCIGQETRVPRSIYHSKGNAESFQSQMRKKNQLPRTVKPRTL